MATKNKEISKFNTEEFPWAIFHKNSFGNQDQLAFTDKFFSTKEDAEKFQKQYKGYYIVKNNFPEKKFKTKEYTIIYTERVGYGNNQMVHYKRIKTKDISKWLDDCEYQSSVWFIFEGHPKLEGENV